MVKKFPANIHKQISNYIYAIYDPREVLPFYVGRGVGDRVFSHLKNSHNKVAQARASCGGSYYTIKRYKDNSIRIVKDGETNPVDSTVSLLREINKEHDLGFTEEDFKQTRSIGKRIIDLLNSI